MSRNRVAAGPEARLPRPKSQPSDPGKILNLSAPLFLHLRNGDGYSTTVPVGLLLRPVGQAGPEDALSPAASYKHQVLYLQR